MTSTPSIATKAYDGLSDLSPHLPIAQASASDTLLTYAMLQEPDPIQVSASATLTLSVSNSTRQAIACGSIVVTLARGTAAGDLSSGYDGLETAVPFGWAATRDGGIITLTPSGDAGEFEGGGRVFVFAGIAVNDQTGTSAVSIVEMASSSAQPTPTLRTTSILVPKFPQQFSLSDLTVVTPQDLDVQYGDTATLMWTGSGENVKYSLSYQPANDGQPVVVPPPLIGSLGPYTSVALTRSHSVMFTLTAMLTVVGQDQPLVAQRQATVTVEALSLHLVIEPPVVGVNGLVRLTWEAPNADHCALEEGTTLPASGTRYAVLTATRMFLLTAFGSQGQVVQKQLTIQVDPTVVATEAAHTIVGAQGNTGAPGGRGYVFLNNCAGTLGETGGRGLDAVLTVALPPIAMTGRPARVIPIAITGGQGGTGGAGGWCIYFDGDGDLGGFTFQSGGNGGTGGNAVMNVTFDGPGDPAQYLVTLVPGAGGAAGVASGGNPPKAGPGSPGASTINGYELL